jgi:Nickel responsive protein SCO4226-like
VPRFLVETYMSRAASGELQAAVARARLAAAELSREGRPTRFIRSFFLPDDEVWFCLFEAQSEAVAAEASRRAELTHTRIQRAIEARS